MACIPWKNLIPLINSTKMELIKNIYSNGLFNQLLYRPLGLNKNSAPSIWITAAALAFVYLMLLLTDGNIIASGMALLPFMLVIITIYKIEYSFYILLFCVLFFDQFGIPGFEPFTYTTDYFRNLKEISYLPYIPAGVVNPIELHLMLMLGIWFFSLPLKRNLSFSGIPVWPAFTLFLITFIYSFVMGIRTGEFLVALWEVRALFYLCFMYLFVPQIITTKKQIKVVVWVSIICITLKALQAVHRFIALGFSTAGFQTLTNHEDPVFASTIFIFAIGLVIFGFKGKEKWLVLLFCIPLILGFYVGLRRAAYAGLIISIATFFVLLPTSEQIRFVKKGLPYICLALIYVGIFWNFSNSRFAGPVNLIKSGLVKPDKETNYQDYYSNLYRDFEDYNLAITIRRNPVTGIGFGNKYDMPLKLANISFPLRDYIPHNEIFWYLIKTGGVGFLMFWIFFNSFAFRGTQILHQLKDPYLKAVCAMVTIAVINQMVVSYFDLQLTYYRNMIYLGTLMGLLPALKAIAQEDEEARAISESIDNNYE